MIVSLSLLLGNRAVHQGLGCLRRYLLGSLTDLEARRPVPYSAAAGFLLGNLSASRNRYSYKMLSISKPRPRAWYAPWPLST